MAKKYRKINNTHKFKGKKVKKRPKVNFIFILFVIIVLSSGLYILKKPSIIGFTIITEESTFEDNLDLVINESKNIFWNLRNPGNLNSIKATGRISKSGSAKVFIEKGNEKLLIFDSTKQLFDVDIQVLPDYKKIYQGDELLIEIRLFNLRGFGSSDVDVTYSIKDTNGNIVAKEEEIITVETQAKFIRKLLIPTDLKSGTYVSFVEVKTEESLIGTSSDSFEVSAKFEDKPINFKYLAFGIIILSLLIIIFIFIIPLINKIKRKKQVKSFVKNLPKEKIEKLKRELKALESAYNSKFISETAYSRGKERIGKKIEKLKK